MRVICTAALLATVVSFGVAADQTPAPPKAHRAAAKPAVAKPALAPEMPVAAENDLVHQYCATCHNDKMKAGGLSLANFDGAQVVDRADVTEKMIRKLRAGMMPPPQARRPDPATIKAFYETLENTIDASAAAHPNPGWRPFPRLNRAEDQRAIQDLVGLDVDVTG